MIGKQAGNWMWRSPEAHARGPVNKPSDVFSFALVVSSDIWKISQAQLVTGGPLVHLRRP